VPNFLPFSQPQILNDGRKGLLQQPSHVHSLGHVMVAVLPHRHTLRRFLRSGRVDLKLNLDAATASAAAVGGGGGGVVAIVAAVVTFEGVGAASHWTGETRTVDSLGDPIGSVVMVIRFREYRHLELTVKLLFLCTCIFVLFIHFPLSLSLSSLLRVSNSGHITYALLQRLFLPGPFFSTWKRKIEKQNVSNLRMVMIRVCDTN